MEKIWIKRHFFAHKCMFLGYEWAKFEYNTTLKALKFNRTPAFYWRGYGMFSMKSYVDKSNLIWSSNLNILLMCFSFSFYLQRPPSSSLSGYGLGNDEARSPSSGGGTPGLLSHQPGSHISGDNISEAGKTTIFCLLRLRYLQTWKLLAS